MRLPIAAMDYAPCSPPTNYGRCVCSRCESMGALIRQNLESICRETGRPIVPELVPE